MIIFTKNHIFMAYDLYGILECQGYEEDPRSSLKVEITMLLTKGQQWNCFGLFQSKIENKI